MGLDLGPVLLSISPVLMFVTCVFPRVIAGLLGGLVNSLLKPAGKPRLAGALSGFSVAFFNTVLLLGTMTLLFYNTFVAPWSVGEGAENTVMGVVLFIAGLYLLQAVVEAVLCALVSSTVSSIMERYFPMPSPKGD